MDFPWAGLTQTTKGAGPVCREPFSALKWVLSTHAGHCHWPCWGHGAHRQSDQQAGRRPPPLLAEPSTLGIFGNLPVLTFHEGVSREAHFLWAPASLGDGQLRTRMAKGSPPKGQRDKLLWHVGHQQERPRQHRGCSVHWGRPTPGALWTDTTPLGMTWGSWSFLLGPLTSKVPRT